MSQSPQNRFQPEQKIDVQGQSAIEGHANWKLRLSAACTDLVWITFLYWFFVKFFKFSPLLPLKESLLFNGFILGLFLIQVQLISGTVGQRLWGLEKKQGLKNLFSKPYVRRKNSGMSGVFAVGAMVFSILVSLGLTKSAFFSHPLFQKANTLTWKHYVPPKSSQKNWVTLPFYYTLGAWPKHFSTKLNVEHNQPVLYSIPYEKGPPKQFAGRIYARWEVPDISIVIEGPKTPIAVNDQELFKKCITEFSKLSSKNFIACMSVRQATLNRHLSEMGSVSPLSYQIRWIEVQNPHLSKKEWVRGVLITARGKKRFQDRMVIITPNGAHQTIILNRPAGEKGDLAFGLFKQTIGTLRVSSQLKYGRALVNQKLSKTQMKGLKPTKNPYTFMDKLSEIQALLLAKISVDPKNFEAYYHLGGTSYLMFKQALKLRDQMTAQRNLDLARRIDEWTATVKPMIRSSYLFAKDIAPNHPNTDRLYSIWAEVQKL